MKIIIFLLISIFGLSAAAYAGDGAIKDTSGLALPINGALCVAIGILYRQLIKANDRLYQVIQDQQILMQGVTEALKAIGK